MAKGYLEHYLESVETLPSDLQRNFALMRELDQQAENESSRVEERCKTFLQGMGKMSSDDKKTQLESIQGLFKNTIDLGDQKVALAVQTYETVDKHIRQLDSDLTQFEVENAVEAPTSQQKKRRKFTPADAVSDMPVDPNEPTYCLCHQVSYGEMIACDNEDCSTEWFHFACVNLKAKPKTKWCVSFFSLLSFFFRFLLKFFV